MADTYCPHCHVATRLRPHCDAANACTWLKCENCRMTWHPERNVYYDREGKLVHTDG